MNIPKLRDLFRRLRAQPTPTWAYPICPQCRISMQPEKQSVNYKCPKCKLRLWKGKTAGELINQGDYRGEI